MDAKRTGGMIAIGVLNIIIGAGGGLVALLMLLGGGLAMAAGPALEGEAGAEFSGMATAAGGLMMGIGFVLMLLWGCLAIAGLGVLMLRPWGRILSMVCGAVVTLAMSWSIFESGFGVMSTAMFAYGICLVGVFMRPEWKFAFTGTSLDQPVSMPAPNPGPAGDAVPFMAGIPAAPSGAADDDDGLPSILAGRSTQGETSTAGTPARDGEGRQAA